MMRNYWIRIFGGALAVFAAGMAIWGVGRGIAQGARQTVARVEEASKSDPLLVEIDGASVGHAEGLKVAVTKRSIDSISFAIRLDSLGPGATRPERCFLLNVTPSEDDDTARLRCDSRHREADATTVGHIRLEPSGELIPIQVPLDMAKRMWRRERSTLTNYFGSTTTGVLSDAFVRISETGRDGIVKVGSTAATVDIGDDPNGGHIRVVTKDGRELVNITGGEQGGRVLIRDAQGRELVNIVGNEHGGGTVDVRGRDERGAVNAANLAAARGELGRELGEMARRLAAARSDGERAELERQMDALNRAMEALNNLPEPPEPPSPPKR